MTYKTIIDKKALQSFIQWLPAVQQNECYLVELYSRPGFAGRTSGVTYPWNKAMLFAQTCCQSAARIIPELCRMETARGSYVDLNRQPLPQEALAVRIYLNPRSHRLAAFDLQSQLVTCLKDGSTSFSLPKLAMASLRRSPAQLQFVGVHYRAISSFEVSHCLQENDIVNLNAAWLIENRGGCTLIVDDHEVHRKYMNTYTQRLIEICGPNSSAKVSLRYDAAVPIPGCINGGATPHFTSIAEVLAVSA